MKKVLEGYKRSKLLTNTGIIITSLILAIGINFLVIDSTNIGNSLKASVVDSKINENLSDIYLIEGNGLIKLITSKPIEKIRSISINFNYNPEGLKIDSIVSGSNEVINNSNIPGNNNIIVNYNGKTDLKIGDSLFEVNIKKLNNYTQNINLSNAIFIDNSGEIYEPNMSGLSF